jgi:SNF2 family DNA or RNA helicase
VQRVRIICSHAKIEAAVDLARSILNKEPALVIFSSFTQVAKQVHEKLSSSGWPSELLTGETPQKKRQGMVDKFQCGLSSVFVCTFGAGGVGLTLTAASTIILLDRPWTPGQYQIHQIEFKII